MNFIDLGSRLEPMVDDYLIEQLDNAALKLHHPHPQPLPAAPSASTTCALRPRLKERAVLKTMAQGTCWPMCEVVKAKGGALVQ